MPSWEQKLAEDNVETQELLRRRGAEEAQRVSDNFWLGGDVLGFDDGRPGIGINPGGVWFGSYFTFGWRLYVLWAVATLLVVLLIIGVGQALKRSAGPQVPGAAPPTTVQPAAGAPHGP